MSEGRPHEDLLLDGSKFNRRLSLFVSLPVASRSPGGTKHAVELFWGVDKHGRGSIYVGDEISLQWNAVGELRRIYWNGANLAASSGHLEELKRRGTESSQKRVTLERVRLDETQLHELLNDCRLLLVSVQDILLSNTFQIRGSIPSDEPITEELAHHIQKQLQGDSLKIAPSPN
ncbi:MAG: hypothetical protein ACE361_09145 [Aureliella sp.]